MVRTTKTKVEKSSLFSERVCIVCYTICEKRIIHSNVSLKKDTTNKPVFLIPITRVVYVFFERIILPRLKQENTYGIK